MDAYIILSQGALGADENDTALDSILRTLAAACPHQENEWVTKYGTKYENDTFSMARYCWCDEDNCPWCTGCTCDEVATTYFIGGEEVSNQKYLEWLSNLPLLPYGKPEFGAALEEREQYKKEHSAAFFDASLQCPYCSGTQFKEFGAEPGRSAPNFWHKPTNFKVWWYKYIGRGMETNGVEADLLEVLRDCLASIKERETHGP